jgi:MFS family permease
MYAFLQSDWTVLTYHSSAFESLVVAMIGDLFFVHQRGGFMTLIQFILGAASNFSAIIVGPIATNLGWRWLFHILILRPRNEL